jgi:TPR repeat protein
MFYYADMLESGKGVSQDMGKAVCLYKLAAEKGCLPAVGYVGFLIYHRNGVPQNQTTGLTVMTSVAEAGDSSSCLRLAQICKDHGKDAKAFEFYRRAAEKRHTLAIFHLARALEYGVGCAKDLGQAAHLYQTLITVRADDEAMVHLGVMKLAGHGIDTEVEGAGHSSDAPCRWDMR